MKHKLFRLCMLSSLLLSLLAVQPVSAVGGLWIPTGSMTVPRESQTATLLPNGKVLVAGGNHGTKLASAELYDPATGRWTATGSMGTTRDGHTATLLGNGKVLVAGGSEQGGGALNSAELYDPATGVWTFTGSMTALHVRDAATLLLDGRVLVVGRTAELYDPATGEWMQTGPLIAPRSYNHTATLLPNGKVLVAGGESGGVLAHAELYDPATGTWTATGFMRTARSVHTATLLPNGKVLVAGGYDHGFEVLASAELYDPATGMWTPINSMGTRRVWHAATLLPNGKVLVSGGGAPEAPGSGESYDPATGTWTATGSMGTARRYHPTVLLPLAGGKVLVAGGRDDATNLTLASAELYTPTQVLQPKSNAPQDGWVLESGESSNQGGARNATAASLIVGDNAGNQQYRAVLSFNTNSLPDTAVMTRVVLRIRKQSVTGVDPFTTHGKIAIDIRRGAFSGSGALQSTDFQATANMPAAGLIANNPTAGGWYVVRLKATAHAFVNRTGVTQLRLRFQRDDDNDAVADFLRFYSGDAAAPNRPVLVVEYYVP